METVIAFVISQSILFPLIIGLLRFRTVKAEYGPFFWLLVLGFITEIISFILIGKYHASNAIPTNVFVMLEWLLLAWQFHAWGFLKKKKRAFYLLVSMLALIWAVENLVLRKITVFSPYFRILYSFMLTLMSITEINFMITHDNKNLFRDPKFIIYIGFILFFVYQILYEWAYQESMMEEASRFSNTIISLFAYIDALANIIFGIAFLLIPVRRQFKLE